MSTIITFFGTWTLFALWQSTLLLGFALFFEFLYRQSPWRQHLILTFGIFASILTPTISTLLALSGGGMLNVSIFLVSLPEFFVTVLLCGVGLSAVVLFYGIISSRRLMFHALPFPDRESQEALLVGAKTMQNISLPILFTSNEVKSPTVWSWGLHPAILLPERLTETISKTERDAIFLHELAHITRRDHIVMLLVRFCGVFLFWQPLYWFASRQSDLSADESCDLLVLEQGNIPPQDYSEILLRLVAGEIYRPIFQSLSRKEQMMKRINTILDFSNRNGNVSAARKPLWTLVVLAVTMLVTVTLALCQEKKGNGADKDEIKRVDTRIAEIEKTDWFKLLNDKQKKYVHWDERQFAYVYDPKIYEVSSDDRVAIEKRWVKKLEEAEPGHPGRNTLSTYDEAIFGLATIKSNQAAELLLKIAAEKVVKDNAHRHYAAKALGILGDVSVVPELIPLIYHYNFNTRWDSQVALVRLTGQNFGTDAEAWGKWYNENREKLAKDTGKELPVFDAAPVDWTCGNDNTELKKYSKPEEQKKSDDQFFERQSNASDLDTPKITKMEPENGAKDVDPVTVKELRVTFDRDMRSGFSWTGGGEKFPKADKPKWIDKRTCVLPVELEPEKEYQLGINSVSFKNFRSTDGVPVEPIRYQFSTGETRQEEKEDPSVTKHYRVDKNVTDFPKELDDLSKPENAYVLFSRAMCAPDSEGFSTNLDKLHVPFHRGHKSKPIEGDFAKVLLSAQVLEVNIFQNEKAQVIAKLEGKDVRNPFDVRYFENHDEKWLNTGNNRFDSVEDANEKWERIKQMKKMEDPAKPVTSIKDSLKAKVVKSYRVDKKIADFPENFDLSTPENAYVTQKQLIITNREDKFEQLVKMNYYPGDIPERERRGMKEEIAEDWQKTYKEKFVVYEVIRFSDDLTFVFARRQFDKLYDGNLFRKKDDGLWYNLGNFQRFVADEIAGDVDKAAERILQSNVNSDVPKTDKTSTFLDDLPTIKSFDNDAKPLPDGLLAEIQKKREAVKSADYTVQSVFARPVRGETKTTTKTAQFRFQGNDQWLINLSEMMSFPKMESTFLSGCDGEKEWSYINSKSKEKPVYNIREWKNIREKLVCFLDPFKCKGITLEEFQKNYVDQKIQYFGEGEFKGKKLHLFCFKNEAGKITGEIGIDAETLLPVYSRLTITKNLNEVSFSGYLFEIVSLNKEYAVDDFRQKLDTEAKPELKSEPDEGYEYFFIHINDGANGGMSIRTNGQRGVKGTSSSGLN